MEQRAPTSPIRPLPVGTIACIGTFDGMHLGHQALLRRAAERGERIAAVTFEPRPVEVLAPDRALPRLQSARQRARICRALGVDVLVLLPFDAAIARMSPVEWLDTFVVRGLRPEAIVVGEDFRFGHRRSGDVETLSEALGAAGIRCEALPLRTTPAGDKIGSSAIREAIASGDVERARRWLGYAHAVDGPVVHGERRGRTLGYPTANVRADGVLPAPGVYAGWATDVETSSTWPAAINVGLNPTFDTARTTGLEAHLIDTTLDDDGLYDRVLEVAFVARLRAERRFESVDALRAAIGEDVSTARRVVEGTESSLRPRPVRAATQETGT